MVVNIRELKLKLKRKYMIPIVKLNIWLKVYGLKKMVLLLIVTFLMMGCQPKNEMTVINNDEVLVKLADLDSTLDTTFHEMYLDFQEMKDRLDTIEEHQSYDVDMVCLTKSIVGLQNQLGSSLNYLVYQDDVIKYSFKSTNSNLIGEHDIEYMIWNCGRDWDYETIKN